MPLITHQPDEDELREKLYREMDNQALDLIWDTLEYIKTHEPYINLGPQGNAEVLRRAEIRALIPKAIANNIELTTEEETPLVFAVADFEAGFTTSENGTGVVNVRIGSLPANGTLTLDSVAVAVNDVIVAADIPDLVYTPDAEFVGEDSFYWNAFDSIVYAKYNAICYIDVTAAPPPP